MRLGRGYDPSQLQVRSGRRRGPGGVALGGGGLGIIGLVLAFVFGGNALAGGFPAVDAGTGGFDQRATSRGARDVPRGEQELTSFVGAVVSDVQEYWSETFARNGQRYPVTQLVIFSGATQTGCGPGSAETGPFYCPADSLVYLDLGFFRELERRFGAPGDFAQAYVIAHEFGHHVQNVLGTSSRVAQLQQRSPGQANELSVRLELQADCLAGTWAHSAYEEGQLEEGDVEEGLNAAASVGDDRIQSQSGARVDPERWTHGSSQQRVTWFSKGLERGTVESCDTF